MSILIKDMEMPRSCRECKLVEGNYYCPFTGVSWMQRGEEYYNKKHPDCPLIEIPQHGRLIDADALHKLFEDQWHYLQVLDWNENPTAEAVQSGINWCINTMHDDAPTIIPAEPCNDLAKPNNDADCPPSIPLEQVWTELFGEEGE